MNAKHLLLAMLVGLAGCADTDQPIQTNTAPIAAAPNPAPTNAAAIPDAEVPVHVVPYGPNNTVPQPNPPCTQCPWGNTPIDPR